jgi:hypothetical protein
MIVGIAMTSVAKNWKPNEALSFLKFSNLILGLNQTSTGIQGSVKGSQN